MKISRLPYKWRRRVRIASSFFSNSVQLISAAISLVVALAGLNIWNWLTTNPQRLASTASFLLGVIVTVGYIFLSFLIAPNYRWILQGYRCISAEYLLQINDKELQIISQTINVKIRALQNEIDLFELRYRWTGDDKENLPQVLSKGHHLLGPPRRRGDWMFYFVYFEEPLNRGDYTEIQVKQELNNAQHKFRPRLTKKLTEPLDRLTLRVKFPKDCNVNDIICRDEHVHGLTATLKTDIEGTIDASGEIRWEINQLENDHNYGIHWEWTA